MIKPSPSAGVYVYGEGPDGRKALLKADQQGRLLTTHADGVSGYHSTSLEQEVVLSDASRLLFIKGDIDPGATDNTAFFIHILDKDSAPSPGDTVDDVITTIPVDHENGYRTPFETEVQRAFVQSEGGLVVALSRDRYKYKQGLASADKAHFEIDYTKA